MNCQATRTITVASTRCTSSSQTWRGSSATVSLAVFNYHFGNVPEIMACVALSAVPLLALYLVARRQIISGLAAGFGS